MSAEPVVLHETTTGTRLVWVLNRDSRPYKEDYNGTLIVVPPNNEKKVKMPFLEARKFLSRGKPPAVYLPNGEVVTGPKALYTEEIAAEVEKEKPVVDTDTKCMICNSVFDSPKALQIHVGRMHKDAEPGAKA